GAVEHDAVVAVELGECRLGVGVDTLRRRRGLGDDTKRIAAAPGLKEFLAAELNVGRPAEMIGDELERRAATLRAVVVPDLLAKIERAHACGTAAIPA